MTLMEKVARDAFPHGAHLRCANPGCDRGERITTADCAMYLSQGWPKHCGGTMRIVQNQNPTVGHTASESPEPEST